MRTDENGFTLVELLAVIVILSILMVIAVPGVLKTVTETKIDSFKTEAESLLKTARQEYVLDVQNGGFIKAYCKDNTIVTLNDNNVKTLEYLTSEKDFKYRIEFDRNGNITKFILKNTQYAISITGTAISTEDINNIPREDVSLEPTKSDFNINCP